MNYSINVTLTDKDYYTFNKFCLLKSHYGKKRNITFRLALCVISLFPILYSLFRSGFSSAIIANALLLIIFQLLVNPFYSLTIKLNMNSLKKSGKLPYSANTHFDFLNDKFVETTLEGKNEVNYSAVERVSVTAGYIYVHINSLSGHILPRSAFESKEQYSDFLEFLKTKCNTIDIY